MGELYHASYKRGLKEILPSVSSHGRQWVYASNDLVISILFLSPTGGDLTCQIGRHEGVPFVCERFKGAFEVRYKNNAGSIYVVDDDGFLDGKTEWPDELVCPHPKSIVREIPVENVEEYLLNFQSQGKLNIFRYPDRPCDIPVDDSDLVEKCVTFIQTFGEDFWKDIEQYQPGLVERVREKINS